MRYFSGRKPRLENFNENFVSKIFLDIGNKQVKEKNWNVTRWKFNFLGTSIVPNTSHTFDAQIIWKLSFMISYTARWMNVWLSSKHRLHG